MPVMNTIDIIVPDVGEAARLLIDVFLAEEQVNEPGFAQVILGGTTLMLSTGAMVDIPPATGIILHLEVDDPRRWAEEALDRGASQLNPYTETDWGTASVMLQGPAGVVIDVFKQLEDEPNLHP